MKSFLKPLFAGIATVAFFSSCNTTIGLARDMRILSEEVEKKADETYNGPSGGEFSDSGEDFSGAAPVY